MEIKLPEKQIAALYTAVGKLAIKEVPVITPSDDFCLVKVDRCGICGSDLHNFRGQSMRNTFAEWVRLGFADGHEYTGTVVAVGPRVRSIKVGMRVVAECTRHCGICPFCKKGMYNICIERKDLVWRGHGGFAQYATAPEHALYPIPTTLDPARAALVEPLACSIRAVNHGNHATGGRILVVGAGVIGLFCAVFAQKVTTNEVLLVSKYKHQGDTAKRMGLSHVVKTEELSAETADLVIDAVGSSESFNQALHGVKRGGCIVLVGSPTASRNINLGVVVGKEIIIQGSLSYARDNLIPDFQRAIDLLAKDSYHS
jgi:L-iditol 2-dehydrogenase